MKYRVILILVVLMFSFTPIACSGSLVAEPQPLGEILVKIYPDESISLNGYITSTATSKEKLPEELSFKMYMKPLTQNLTEQKISLFVKIQPPEDLKQREMLSKLEFNSIIKIDGGREYTGTYIEFTAEIPETFTISGEVKSRSDNVERISDVNFTATTRLYYEVLNITKDQTNQIVMFFPVVEEMLKIAVQEATENLISIEKLELTKHQVGEKYCELTFEGRVKGDFINGLMKAMEKQPIIPETTPTQPLNQERVEDMKVFIEEITKLNYSWVKSSEAKVYWDKDQLALKVEGETIFEGDINKQFTEAINVVVENLPLLMEEEPPEEFKTVLDMIVSTYTTLNVSYGLRSLSIDLKTSRETGVLRFSNFRIKSESLPILLNYIGGLSEKAKLENLTLTIQGSSSVKQMVELEIPEETTKPSLKQGVFSASWRFKDLENLGRIKVVKKPNTIGVIDFNYRLSEAVIDGEAVKVEVFTNSTITEPPTISRSKVSITVIGPEETVGATAINIPRKLVDGVILARINGEIYKPRVKILNNYYTVYLEYPHSQKAIEVFWVKPSLTLSLSRAETVVGEEVRVSGSLVADNTPLKGETVEIQVNGVTLANPTVSLNGSYTSTVSFNKDGIYNVVAVYKFLDQTFRSGEATINVVSAWYQNVAVTGLIVAVVAVGVIVALRRKRKTT